MKRQAKNSTFLKLVRVSKRNRLHRTVDAAR